MAQYRVTVTTPNGKSGDGMDVRARSEEEARTKALRATDPAFTVVSKVELVESPPATKRRRRGARSTA